MEIDRNCMGQLRIDLDKMLVELGQKHGLTIKTGNGSWDMGGQTAKYTVNISVPDTSPDKELLKRRYPDYLGKKITLQGESYLVSGLSSRGTSFIVIRTTDNKSYRVKHSVVTRQLGANNGL